MPNVRFKLESVLWRHNKGVEALAEASGLAKTTVDNIVNNKAKAVKLETLGKLVEGLERLTGKPVSFDDVLEKRPLEESVILENIVIDAKPIGWEALKKLIPDWSPSERAHNERVWAELELKKHAAAEEGSSRLRDVEHQLI